jgi:transposase
MPGYLRKIAVHAVEENGHSPEEVIKIFGFSRGTIYDWLKRYRQDGYAGLDSKKAPGAVPEVTAEMDAWLKQTVLEQTPEDFGYDTTLWTCDLLAQLLAGVQPVARARYAASGMLKSGSLAAYRHVI